MEGCTPDDHLEDRAGKRQHQALHAQPDLLPPASPQGKTSDHSHRVGAKGEQIQELGFLVARLTEARGVWAAQDLSGFSSRAKGIPSPAFSCRSAHPREPAWTPSAGVSPRSPLCLSQSLPPGCLRSKIIILCLVINLLCEHRLSALCLLIK